MPSPKSATPIENRLLNLLPAAELDAFRGKLKPVELTPKQLLAEIDRPVENAYFVELGTVSMITLLADGTRIEVGLVGPEGFVGLPLLLGGATSAVDAMVQVEGKALGLSAADFRKALVDAPSLPGLLLRYVDSFYAQVAQTAACNGRHQIEQRLARWLLMTHDRSTANSFTMTQEFMSTLLGVRRPGVTIAVGTLQRAGLIRHARGKVEIIDRPRLEEAACECYAQVARRFAWLK